MLGKAITLFVLIIGVVGERNGIDFKHIKFEVFYPKGLKVSLPDAMDITSFSINANINKPVLRHIPGIFNSFTNTLRDNYWTIEVPSVELKIGDTINYICFVERAGLGYYYTGNFYVQEYATTGGGDINNNIPVIPVGTKCQDKRSLINQCMKVVMNISNELEKQRDQISDLQEENRILKSVLENDLEASKQMKLSGLLPSGGSPLAIAQDIVREKLRSSVVVSSAMRKGKEIVFKVHRLADKLAIIKAANKYLRYSRILLSS